jgi:hypothetical protein
MLTCPAALSLQRCRRENRPDSYQGRISIKNKNQTDEKNNRFINDHIRWSNASTWWP